MAEFSVRKPFTVLVGVIMVIVLGIVSFSKMTADLLPNISLPYMVVMTTYGGSAKNCQCQPQVGGLSLAPRVALNCTEWKSDSRQPTPEKGPSLSALGGKFRPPSTPIAILST